MKVRQLKHYQGSWLGYKDTVKDCGCIFRIEDCDNSSLVNGYQPKEEYYLCPRHFKTIGRMHYLEKRAQFMLDVIKFDLRRRLQEISTGQPIYSDGGPTREIEVDVDHKDEQIEDCDIHNCIERPLKPFEGARFRKRIGVQRYRQQNSQQIQQDRQQHEKQEPRNIIMDLSTGDVSIDDEKRLNKLLDKYYPLISPGMLGQAIYTACEKGLWHVASALFERRPDEVQADLNEAFPGMFEHIEKMVTTKEFVNFFKK